MENQEISGERFCRLMREIERGGTSRTSFDSWEVEFLVDMDNCVSAAPVRANVWQRYVRSAVKRIEEGGREPLKLSEYLAGRGVSINGCDQF
jgi:hypothetical protein